MTNAEINYLLQDMSADRVHRIKLAMRDAMFRWSGVLRIQRATAILAAQEVAVITECFGQHLTEIKPNSMS